jgi:hypothetical protein
MIDGGILLGVGFLVGAIVHALEESDKSSLRRTVVDLEASHRALERRMREATTREVAQRAERLKLALNWSRARLEKHLAEREAPIGALQRVWGIGKSLTKIISDLPSDGTLEPRAAEFFALVAKAQNGVQLSHEEIFTIDSFIADEVPEFLHEFYEELLSAEFRRRGRELADSEKARDEADREERFSRLQDTVEGAPLRAAAIAQLRARREQLDKDIVRLARERDTIGRNLVLVNRLGRAAQVDDDYDRLARGILERIVRKHDLAPGDETFLDAYRDRYLLEVRGVLKESRGIDLLGA